MYSKAPARENVPRELLKWFQTLDLSYSIKNPKRDFCNGFLVAEIFSRYYPSGISMHSFENGSSLACKKNNWGQIMLLLDKIDIKYTKEEVDGIIFCNEGFVIPFLAKCYKHLTNRNIKIPKINVEDDIPGYAKNNASTAIHLSMKEGDVADSKNDEYISNRMQHTLENHETKLQDDKILNPNRYSSMSGSLNATRTVKGVNRTLTQSKPMPAVDAKKVEVKQVDKNVSHVRAQMELQVASSSASRLESSASIGAPIKDDVSHPVGPLSILEFFDNAAKEQHKIDDSVPIPFIAITDLLSKRGMNANTTDNNNNGNTNGNTAIDALNAIFSECLTKVQSLIQICCNSPREFWNLSDLLYPVFQYLPLNTQVFDTFRSFMKLFAEGIAHQDKKLSSGLFCDYLLPKFAVLICNYSDRIEFLMNILAYFVTGDNPDRSRVLKMLKEKIDNIPCFILAMSILINSELELPQEIIDLYLYYSQIGLKNPNPTVRASGVCILANLATRDLNAVLACYDQIMTIRNDKWWEVQAQLVRLIYNILTSNNDNNSNVSDDLISIYLDILIPSNPPNVLMVALSYGVHLLPMYSQMNYPFIECLLSLPTNIYKPLLQKVDNILYPYQTTTTIHINGIIQYWHPSDLIECFLTFVESNKLEVLDLNHLDVLNELVICAISNENEINEIQEQEETWKHVILSIMDYLICALNEVDTCQIASEIIRNVVKNGSFAFDMLSNRLFVGVFRLIYPVNEEGNPLCQDNIVDFAASLLQNKTDYGDALTKNINTFLNESPDNAALASKLIQLIN